MISIFKCPSIYFLMLLSAAPHSRNTKLVQPSGFTEMQTEAQGEAGLAKGHAPGVGPCIPTGIHTGDGGVHTRRSVMGPRHPGDLDLLGDLSLVVHCPLLAGPSAMRILQRGALLQNRDDPILPEVRSWGSHERHYGRGGICTWL